MKKILFVVILLGLFVGTVSAVSGNGGFESGVLYPWSPIDWTTSDMVSIESEAAHTGTKGLYVETYGDSISIAQFYPAGYLYTHNLSVWYKVSDLNPTASNFVAVYLNLDFSYDAVVVEDESPVVGDWVHVDMSLADILALNSWSETDFDSNDIMELVLRVDGGNATVPTIVYFDDVAIAEDEHEFSNGGFETGVFSSSDWILPDPDMYGGNQDDISVSDLESATGDYSVRYYSKITRPAQAYPTLFQEIPYDWDFLRLKYKVANSSGTATNHPSAGIWIQIMYGDGDFVWIEYYILTPPEGEWVELNVSRADVLSESGYTEQDIIDSEQSTVFLNLEIFTGAANAGTRVSDIYIDDVAFKAEAPVAPVACEGFPNCDLETGDFTDWTVPMELPAELYVNEAAAHWGTYGAGMNPTEIYNGYGYTYGIQSFSTGDVDLSSHGNITGLDFWYKIDTSSYSGIGMTGVQIGLPVDGEGVLWLVDEINPSPTGWTHYSISGTDLYALLESEQPGFSFTQDFYIDFIGYTYKETSGAGTASLEMYVDDVSITFDEPAPPAGYNSTLVLEVIALIFIFLLASIWSEENARFGYVIIPLVTAFFWWAGFLPFAYMTTVIPLMIFMGIFSFLRMQAKYKWGFMGTSGGLLFKIVFFLIMLQMVIGYVNGMYLFATPAVSTPDNAATHYTLASAQDVYGGSSYGINVVNMLTAGLLSAWTAFKVLWTMLSSIFFIYPTLVTQFHIPVALSLLLQTGIYILYGLELFNMVFKPFKAAEV